MSAWDPRVDVSNILGHVSRLMNEANRPRSADPSYDEAAFAPPVDIVENDKSLRLLVELPGVQREGIEINVENSVLFIEGEKKRASASGTWRRSERAHGRFARQFTLPRTVDAAKIAACFQDGILEITLPKADAAIPRKIQVG